MSIQFPANPPLNDTFDYDGKTYIWDGEKWTASISNSFDDAYVNIDGDTMTGDLTVPSLNGSALGGFRNQIINGSMTIAQRGSTKNNFGPAFQPETVDRWIFGASAAVQVNATRVNNFFPEAPAGYSLEVGAASGDSANIRLGQTVELEVPGTQSQFVKGSEWTFSWYSSYSQVTAEFAFVDDGRLTNQVFMTDVDARKSLGNSRYSITFRIDKDVAPGFTSRALMVWMSGFANPTRIGCCQLEPGSQPTPFEMRPIGTELALCQRYYYTTRSKDYSYPSNSAAGGQILRIVERHPVEMRIAPTINIAGGVAVDRASGMLSASSINTDGITLQGTGAAGDGAMGYNGLYWTADAEL